MSLKNKTWKITQRQKQLERIVSSFEKEDGIEYEIILGKKPVKLPDKRPPNQLNVVSSTQFDEPDEVHLKNQRS